MVLESLYISRTYGENSFYSGKATFMSNNGSFTVKFSEDIARKILMICADDIIETAADVANSIVAPIRDSKQSNIKVKP